MTISSVITNSSSPSNSLFSILGGQQASQPTQAQLLSQAVLSDNDSPLFSVLSENEQTNNQSLAVFAMAAGTDQDQAGNYQGAAQDFTLSISYNPSQSNIVTAENLIGTADLQDSNTTGAISAYKSSLAANSQDDATYVSLGNIYFSQKDYTDAQKNYATAVSLNPTSSTDEYSLGQAYLSEGKYQEAENMFNKVISMNPTDKSGYYALGQTYSKEGKYNDAINEFNKVITLAPSFYTVHVDLGEAYAHLGQTNNANAQLSIVKANDPNDDSLLSTYIDSVTKPQIIAAYGNASNGFNTNLGPNTQVSSLSPSLATPNGTQLFSMEFVFSKEMNPTSVQNPNNWSISKAQNNTPGGAYNWGLPTNSTDAQIAPIPVSVAYDTSSNTATVSFLVQQNSASNGTIDPSHITFKFNGTDVYGNNMSPSDDQYDGVSQIV
jgi:tetratricopeptide (TPR) repeat protein